MTGTAPSPADRFSSTLEGMRAAIAAEGTRNGLTGRLLAAILGLLDTLMALLADLRASRLAAAASGPNAPRAAGAACAASADATAAWEPAAAELRPSPTGRRADREGRPLHAGSSAHLSRDGGTNCGEAAGGTPVASALADPRCLPRLVHVAAQSPSRWGELCRISSSAVGAFDDSGERVEARFVRESKILD